MSRLTSVLRRREVLVSGAWVASAGVAGVAALAGWGWVLIVALVVNHVADVLLLRVDPRASIWFADRQVGPVQRHLLREALAVLGWITIVRPGAWLVAAVVAGVFVVHATHTAFVVMSSRTRRRQRRPVRWQGLDVQGARTGPPEVPQPLPALGPVIGPQVVLHLDVPLILGLWLGWTLDRAAPVWIGLAVVAAGAVWVAARVLQWHQRVLQLPSRKAQRAAVLAALERHAPQVVVYFSGGLDTTYQLNVWLETIDRIAEPTVIIIREAHHLESLLPTTTPVVVLPQARDVEEFQVPSMAVALYPTTVIRNNHMIRLRGLRHVFINHGDGDKSVTYSPLHRVFDEIWVAGRAACDRYLDRGEGVRPDQLVQVGRPQLAHIEPAAAGAAPRRPLTVLYAPTWEGNFEGVNYSSVAPMGVALVEALLAHPEVRVLFKAHPATGTRLDAAAAARATIEHRLSSAAGHEVVGSEPDALYRAFNEADVLVADISSVVADFLASRKPYLVTNPRGQSVEDFHRDFPSTGGGGILTRGVDELGPELADILGPDSRQARRHELATYFLGEPQADPIQRFTDEVSAAITRHDRELERSAALALDALVEEDQ